MNARDVLPDTASVTLHDSYINYGAVLGLRRMFGLRWGVQVEIGLRGSANQSSAWSEIPARTARGRFSLNTLYQF